MGTLEDPRAMVVSRERDDRKLSEILRAQVFDHVRSGEFLGPEVGAILTSEFDSVLHGVDCVLELRHADRTANHLAVSFEVTVPGQEPWDPFDQIRSELERDEVAPVKYFHSEWLGHKGWLHAPRVHLALPMSRLLAELREQEEGLRVAGALSRRILLRTIAGQLAVFERFALVRNREAALGQLRRARADFSARLDALGVSALLKAGEADREVADVARRLFEVFGDVLEDEEGVGPAG